MHMSFWTSACVLVGLLVLGAVAETTEAPTTAHPTAPPTTPSPTPFPLPAPSWGSCSGPLTSLYQSCATVVVPVFWAAAPSSHDNLTFSLGRVEPGNAVTPNTTVWFLGDDCAQSGLTQWIASMLNLNFYVVGVYPRGSLYGTPRISCDAASTDPTTGWPLPSCGTNLTNAHVDASMFSFTEMALDLNYVIPKLGSPQVNVVLADGFMTEVAQRLQLLQPNPVTAYVLAGFTAPGLYDAITSPLDAFETVARRVLSQCVATEPKCVGWFGGQDPWQVWVRTLEAAYQGSLACSKSLNWGVPSYGTALANIGAMLISSAPDPYTAPAPAATQAFFPAFIYRLQRCNHADVTALTALYTKLNATSNVVPPANSCAANAALRFNLLINEMLQSIPSVDAVVKTISERMVQPSSQYFTALASVAATWPKYNVSADVRRIGIAPQPTALLAGDGDVFSPIELAKYADSLFYTNAHTQSFTIINRGQHPMLSTDARSCLIATLANVATTRTVAQVPSCGGSAVAAYDYLGTSTSASILVDYFSIDNLWEYTVPMGPVNPLPPLPPTPPTAPPTTPSPYGPEPGPPPSNNDKNAVIALSILLAVSWAGALIAVWKLRGGTCCRRDKDFYAELNR